MSDVERLGCPACGGPCDSNARACPFCENHLLALRCPDCAHLHFSGSRLCTQCGRSLKATPLGEATGTDCPRCKNGLAKVRIEQLDMNECGKCGGLFVANDVLNHIVGNKEKIAAYHLPISLDAPVVDHPPAYLKCPSCPTLMTPRNYGRVSGVIVDVCTKHGTWFDAGELTRALDWVAKGGAHKTLERDRQDLKQQERTLRDRMKKEATRELRAMPRRDEGEAVSASVFVIMLQVLIDTLFDA